MEVPTCPRCSVVMERGFMMDHSRHSYVRPAQWVSGEPERSIWFGVKTGGRSRHDVASFRCPRCGRLDLFAPEAS